MFFNKQYIKENKKTFGARHELTEGDGFPGTDVCQVAPDITLLELYLNLEDLHMLSEFFFRSGEKLKQLTDVRM
jgi:hypothetical protein